MNVDLYERIWMWGVGVVLALFFATTAMAAFGRSAHPPSHVETIDPRQLFSDPRFQQQGVSVDDNGNIHVHVIGLTFAWMPAEFTLPTGVDVTFHVTALDVVHGYQIIRTNGQTMALPGYVSRYTMQFREPGEYLVVCNEYCGVGHHEMYGTITVVPRDQWQAPAARTPAMHVRPAGGAHAH